MTFSPSKSIHLQVTNLSAIMMITWVKSRAISGVKEEIFFYLTSASIKNRQTWPWSKLLYATLFLGTKLGILGHQFYAQVWTKIRLKLHAQENARAVTSKWGNFLTKKKPSSELELNASRSWTSVNNYVPFPPRPRALRSGRKWHYKGANKQYSLKKSCHYHYCQ